MKSISNIQQPPMAPDFLENPYIFYSKARASGDFVFWEDYQIVMAASFEAVKAVMIQPAMGRELPAAARAGRPAHLNAYHRIDDHSLLRLEGPEHDRLRKAAVGALSDEAVLLMAPAISQICDALIDRFAAQSPVDLQSAFADQVSGITLMRLLGLPDDARTQTQKWARDIDKLFHARRDRATEDAAEQAAIAFTDFMSAHLAHLRRSGASDDFIGRVMASQKTIADEEIMALVLLIIQAGTGVTAYAIGTAIHALIDFPERTLALSPDQIGATVSECLRIETPFHIIRRYAQEDVTILGNKFTRDTQIGCLIGSACHDDAVWPDGNKFDPFRALRPHLGFGAGVHACIGKALTHTIMKIALPSLFSRCPSMRLVSKPVFADDYMFRRLERLDVQI
jgi:unspecific monooxygenase